MDKKKTEQGAPIASPMLESEHESSVSRPRASFSLKLPGMKKNPDPEKAKLFSNKEADAELEKMTLIYQQGASLLDDLLEVIVKDHEPVSIWELSDEEAEMLAEMHLEKAKTDPGAARSARVMLALYDRMYRWMIALPRLKASGSHIKKHGGLSFK